MFRAWRRYHEHHTLPASGGTLDQAQLFMSAVDLIDSGHLLYRVEGERKKELAKKFAKTMGIDKKPRR